MTATAIMRDVVECPLCHSHARDLVTLVCCGGTACRGCLDKYSAEQSSLLQGNEKWMIPCVFCKAAFFCKHKELNVVPRDSPRMAQGVSLEKESSEKGTGSRAGRNEDHSTPSPQARNAFGDQEEKLQTPSSDSADPVKWHMPLMLLSSIAGGESADTDSSSRTSKKDMAAKRKDHHSALRSTHVVTRDQVTSPVNVVDPTECHMPLLMLSSIAGGECPPDKDLNAVTEDDSTAQSYGSPVPADEQDDNDESSSTRILDLTTTSPKPMASPPSAPRKGPRQLVKRKSLPEEELDSPQKGQEWLRIRSFIQHFKSPQDPDGEHHHHIAFRDETSHRSSPPEATRRSRRISGPSSMDAYICGEPRVHDVILGRGGAAAGPILKHDGNLWWHERLTAHVYDYQKADLPECQKIASRVVQDIRNRKPPGRFVQKDVETGKWFDVGNKRAVETTNKALYDMVTTPGLLAHRSVNNNNHSINKSSTRTSEEQPLMRPTKKLKIAPFDRTPLSSEKSSVRLLQDYDLDGASCGGIKPQSWDVLLGRGAGLMNHEGNVWWRNLLANYVDVYLTADRVERKKIAAIAVSQTRNRNPPGRFLEKDPKTKRWLDIGDEKATKKAYVAIRDMIHSHNGPSTPLPTGKSKENPTRPVKKPKDKSSNHNKKVDKKNGAKLHSSLSKKKKSRSSGASRLDQPLDFIVGEPTLSDVVLGRGAGPMSHKGNVRWRHLLSTYMESYSQADRPTRKRIAAAAVAEIRTLPGRFLQKDPETQQWFDIGNKKAEKKASQALRDMMDGSAKAPRKTSNDG